MRSGPTRSNPSLRNCSVHPLPLITHLLPPAIPTLSGAGGAKKAHSPPSRLWNSTPMTSRNRSTFVFLTLAITALTSLAATAQRAASTGPQNVPLTAKVPVDPRIIVGTLPNGLRYYLRANKQPLGRAELRLVVNAGSILEDDDQRGLAHFVEHMCFNGTRHFPKQDVVAFLQSTGVRFGAHINANTSFDQTVYQLQIPTDSPAVVDRSLLILEDW